MPTRRRRREEVCLMNKASKDWKKIPALLGNLVENHKDVLFSMVGLSIVKAIMESFHQKYGVNNYDNGVEFWFELDVQ